MEQVGTQMTTAWEKATFLESGEILQSYSIDTAVGRKLYLGHDKENFFERYYFLSLQKQFLEKWGHMPLSPLVPTVQKRTKSRKTKFVAGKES